MSELMNVRNNRQDFRRQLLTTASALALLANVCGAEGAEASDQDTNRPTVWIELGGQLQRLIGSHEVYSPSFTGGITQAPLQSALDVQQPAMYALGIDGKISFQPSDSEWTFSAAVRYGRSNASRLRHHQTANALVPEHFNLNPPYSSRAVGPKYYYPSAHVKFAGGAAKQAATNGIIDFQAGKDIGLGMFGTQTTSVLSVGIRIAQFTSKSSATLHAEPDVQYPTAAITSKYERNAFLHAHVHFHDYSAVADAQRSFRGLGPSLAWNASLPFVGDLRRGEMSFDWGLNGAILFGRQKASGHHKSVTQSYLETSWKGGGVHGNVHGGRFQNLYAAHYYTGGATSHRTNAAAFDRARTVVVPNLGGFAGMSYQVENFKAVLGYRADFFFGAMDDGYDAAQTENRGFFGPFASISIGLP